MSAAVIELPPAYAQHAAHVLAAVEAGQAPTLAPPAKYATARTPGLATLGGTAARVSRLLGEPFMPWQQQVADVALELDPDRPGCFRYPLVCITVPRQAGKTTLMRAIRTTRAMVYQRQVILMTAQTGKDARKQWAKLVERAQRPGSPLAPFVVVRQSQGSEALTFPNGSGISPFAPTPKSVHGDTTHLWDVDEAWAFGPEDGAALIEALDPTQITVQDRQAYLFSTQGTAASTWWNAYVEQGREATADPTSRMAYFEWSAPTDDKGAPINPYDPLTVASFHPAVGHTQQLADLMDKATRVPEQVWHRAYLNLLPGGTVVVSASGMDPELWDELGTEALGGGPQAVPGGSAVTIGYAVASDRTGASIWAAWTRPEDGRTHLQLVASQPGAAWLPGALVQLQEALSPRAIVANDGGLTRNATAEAQRRGLAVTTYPTRDYTEACTGLVAAVADGEVTHDGTQAVADAIAVAVMRPMAGSRGWDERASGGPIDHLQAAAVAHHAAEGATPTVQLF